MPPDDEENTERLIKAKRELALKAGIPSGVGALVLIIIAWCCADHRRKKKKMRLLKEKEAKEDAEKSAAAEAALKPEPAVTEHNVTPQPYGPYQAQYQQPVAGAYFPPSSTGSGSQQQLMEDELAFQERRLAERKRALEERKRIAMEEERIAAEEEELRKRKMEGGRLSTYELGGN